MSLAIVTAVRAKYPTPLGAQHLSFLNAVGIELGLGLVSKTSGTFIPHPTAGGVSQDVLMSRDGAAYDVLIDAEGAATPAWNSIAPIDPSRYVPALGLIPPDPGIPPDPLPDPEPQPCDLSDLLAVIDTLQQSVNEVNARLNIQTDILTHLVDLAVEEPEVSVDFPAYTGRFSFGTMRFTPEAKK